MHPDAQPEGLISSGEPFTPGQLNDALMALLTHRLYMTTIVWRSRAQRALRQTGDAADAVISFQVAAESLLFDTYRMLLVDEGRSSGEIDSELALEIAFKALITKKLPHRLGGSWDITLLRVRRSGITGSICTWCGTRLCTRLARLGEDQLQKRGWLTSWMRNFVQTASQEPLPFYWPADLAGRSMGTR